MARKKGGGGKLNRSEIIQARLDPKLHMAAEIMARCERRTLSSLIETLIEEAVEKYKVPAVPTHNAQINMLLDKSPEREEITIKSAVDMIWSPEEADRFAMFALVLPDLLTANENELWFHLRTITYYWAHFPINLVSMSGKVLDEQQTWPLINQQGIVKERLREHWPFLKDILEGYRTFEDLRIMSYSLPDGPIIEKPEDYPLEIKRINYLVD
ncbi:MAG: hypothetical protein A3F11_05845 [Gammaproteobacteria bacterium RIFCSPHIGHO2_12_FULL_37_14]|nr:MAG: hypothetical protein A3F11_05845 [Gammaproteobacteria bacterium RIFCSPHIGHO2_12_FULL_37_14]